MFQAFFSFVISIDQLIVFKKAIVPCIENFATYIFHLNISIGSMTDCFDLCFN